MFEYISKSKVASVDIERVIIYTINIVIFNLFHINKIKRDCSI